MKKIIARALLFALCIAPTLGCADARPPAATTMPWEDPSLSETDRAIRQVTDPEIMELYKTGDLSDFTIDIYDMADEFGNPTEPRYCIYYRFKLCDIKTSEQIKIEVNSDYTIASTEPFDQGMYSCFQNADTIKAIQKAKAKIEEDSKAYGENGPYYFGIDDEGDLCLKLELIVDKEPGSYPEGHPDHEHKFFSERICKAE